MGLTRLAGSEVSAWNSTDSPAGCPRSLLGRHRPQRQFQRFTVSSSFFWQSRFAPLRGSISSLFNSIYLNYIYIKPSSPLAPLPHPASCTSLFSVSVVSVLFFIFLDHTYKRDLMVNTSSGDSSRGTRSEMKARLPGEYFC